MFPLSDASRGYATIAAVLGDEACNTRRVALRHHHTCFETGFNFHGSPPVGGEYDG